MGFVYFIEPNGYPYMTLKEARVDLRYKLNRDVSVHTLYYKTRGPKEAIKRCSFRSIMWLPAW